MIDFLPESAEVLGGEEGEACRLTQHEMVVERGDRLQQAVDSLEECSGSGSGFVILLRIRILATERYLSKVQRNIR
jgi:hypothetical protein